MQQSFSHPSSSSLETTPTFIFIDGSYFIFHRFYSIVNWWKNANANPSEKTEKTELLDEKNILDDTKF
jgi:hypothetical protein